MMRRILMIAIPFVLVVFLILLPKILSTPVGKILFEKAFEQRLDARVSIGSSHLTWLGPQRFQKLSISNAEMQGLVESFESNVPFWFVSRMGKTFSITNGLFSFPSYGDLQVEQVNAQLTNHELFATGHATQGGFFRIHGQLFSTNDFDIAADCKKMPPVILDQLFKGKGLISAALGEFFDLSMTMIYNRQKGTVRANLESSHAEISVQGDLTEGALLLKEPAIGTLRMSSELSRALMERSPLAITAAKNPVTFRIETQKTSFPLFPFTLDQLNVGTASVDLGRVECKGIPGLVSILDLLDSFSFPSQNTPIWFTPIVFSVERGVLYLNRVDALISNSIHICSWGSIDLHNNKLDLIFGIPADTLQRTLGIQNLARNYVLQIPLEGSIRKPKLATGQAAAKIAALLASQQISKKTGILGGIRDLLKKPKEDQEVPLPNRPFPWEKN